MGGESWKVVVSVPSVSFANLSHVHEGLLTLFHVRRKDTRQQSTTLSRTSVIFGRLNAQRESNRQQAMKMVKDADTELLAVRLF